MAANTGTKLHGKNGAIYIGGPKGTGIKVATKSEWTLSLGRDYVDATTFGDTNRTYLVGLRDVSGTFSGLMDVSGDLLINATTSDIVQLYLYADDGASPILLASGPALVDGQISASNADAIRMSGNFRAAGNWTIFTGA
ncbi:MAG TPA: hypothetical protein VFX15_02915 [Actinomycetes bacterium]|nr:hypothetical protein [Actinomycetes bacterium]